MPNGFPVFKGGQLVFFNNGLATFCCECEPQSFYVKENGGVEGGGYLHLVLRLGPVYCDYAIYFSGSSDDNVVIMRGDDIIFQNTGLAWDQGYPWVDQYLCSINACDSISIYNRNIIGPWGIEGTFYLVPLA